MKGAVEFVVHPGVKPSFNQRFKEGETFFFVTLEDVYPGKVIKVERGYLNDTQVKFGYLYTTSGKLAYFQVEDRMFSMFKTEEDAERARQEIVFDKDGIDKAWKTLEAILNEVRDPQ